MHKCTEQHHWWKHTPELCTGGRGLHHSSRQHGGRNTRGRFGDCSKDSCFGRVAALPRDHWGSSHCTTRLHGTPDRGASETPLLCPQGAAAAPQPVLAHANAPELCSIHRGHTAAVRLQLSPQAPHPAGCSAGRCAGHSSTGKAKTTPATDPAVLKLCTESTPACSPHNAPPVLPFYLWPAPTP